MKYIFACGKLRETPSAAHAMGHTRATDARLFWMFLANPGSCASRFRGIIFLVPAAIVLGLTIGCASPGPPRPPSLRLPNPVSDLKAERDGDVVHLTWTSPSKTTDGAPLRPGLQAALCRREAPTPKNSLVCNEIGHLPVAPGPSQTIDTLSPAMTAGTPKLLEYRVEIRNAAGRSAGPSSPAYAASGPAPPAAGPIHIQPRSQGAVISWHPESGAASMQVKRTLTADAPQELPRRLRPRIWRATYVLRRSHPGRRSLCQRPRWAYRRHRHGWRHL
jgi:hypothetical protein